MRGKTWIMVLVALVLGAGAAVAMTKATGDEQTAAAPPADATDKPKGSDKEGKGSGGEGKEDDARDDQDAQQEVEQTVNAYVTALEEGDTEALCDIQAQSLTVKVTASGVSGDEIAEACAEALARLDWAQLWAEWASALDLDDVNVQVKGAQATASFAGGASFTLDRHRSGEWKVDGFKLSSAGAGRSGPQLPQGGGLPGGGSIPSGDTEDGTPPSSGGGSLPSGDGGGSLPGGGANLPSGGDLPVPRGPGR